MKKKKRKNNKFIIFSKLQTNLFNKIRFVIMVTMYYIVHKMLKIKCNLNLCIKDILSKKIHHN